MATNQGLPFKVGQLAESKSFETGFRGAWFRCQIKDIRTRERHTSHYLEYYDFPDEKVKWCRVYQKHKDKGTREERHLMVRPSFPPLYRENEMPDITTTSEVIVVADGIWKVGDLVDWWSDGCYWSAQITDLMGDDKVKILLHEPPFGEGESYDALSKDLRPSLDWSPEHGWTVPTSKGSQTGRYCARLIRPVDQEPGTMHDIADAGPAFDSDTDSSSDSVSSYGSADLMSIPKVPSNPPKERLKKLSEIGSYKETEARNRSVGMELGDTSMVKPSSSDSVSSADGAATAMTTGRTDRYNCNGSSKKMRIIGDENLNSSFSDTIESSILDLEELATRIKWLKRVHEFGLESASAMIPSWKFDEVRVSFK